jgi:hypothetical protein
MSHDSHNHAHPAVVPQQATGNKIAHMQVFLFGLGGFMIIVVAVVATYIYYGWYETSLKFDREEMMIQSQNPAIDARKDVLERVLTTFSVADGAAGKVRIPINMAMDRVVQQYSKR